MDSIDVFRALRGFLGGFEGRTSLCGIHVILGTIECAKYRSNARLLFTILVLAYHGLVQHCSESTWKGSSLAYSSVPKLSCTPMPH